MDDPLNLPPSDPHPSGKRRPLVDAGMGLVFGAGFGLIIGSISGNPALGLVFGAFAGLNVGAALDRRRKNKSNSSKEQ
jgi:uncharacterized protein YqgC (DUF456 family)